MKRAPRDLESAKHWLAFLRNHRETIAAMGFLHDSNDHVSSVPRTMAQVPGHRSTLAYQLTHVATGEPFPSPDGKQIVFEITIERREQIFIMKTDGTSQKQITHDPANHDSPSWSPDGAKIAFVSDANEHSVIYMMNIDGTNVERLTDLVADSIDPTWSADSSRVIYCADDDLHPPKKNASDIFSVDVKTKQVATLISGGTNTYPSWSPDGKKIAFRRMIEDMNSEVYVANSDGSDVRNLTNHPAFDGWPTWSPDGTQIAFSSNRNANFHRLLCRRLSGPFVQSNDRPSKLSYLQRSRERSS